MRPAKPINPEGIETRGLVWRPRKTHWQGYWIARQDIADRGYPIKSRLLWSFESAPTLENWRELSTACDVLQGEMLNWGTQAFGKFDASALFDDTLASLIAIYLNDPDSPYKELRYQASLTYASQMGALRRDAGDLRISSVTFRDFKRLYEGWRKPGKEGEPDRISHAFERIKFVRIVFSFGTLLKLPGCQAARGVLTEMEFKNPKARTEIVDAKQAALIREGAHEIGRPSIALTQSMQDGLIVRQKDVIGELIPTSDPGLSDVHMGRFKWVGGFRWETLDSNFQLTHRLSKSIRGRRAMADPDAGKVLTWNLYLYPPIMEELCRMAGAPLAELRRDMFPASGPMIVAEHTGLPWRQKVFANKWRAIARAKEIPDNVQNRDTRAGGATDAEKKGASLGRIRPALGHANEGTTRLYLRDQAAATAEIARVRFGKDKP